MLVIHTSKEQEEAIFKKYFGPISDFLNGYVYYSEGEHERGKIEYMGYVRSRGELGSCISWRYYPRTKEVQYFSLTVNDRFRYDVVSPAGDFHDRLLKISEKERTKFWNGSGGIL